MCNWKVDKTAGHYYCEDCGLDLSMEDMRDLYENTKSENARLHAAGNRMAYYILAYMNSGNDFTRSTAVMNMQQAEKEWQEATRE